MVRRSARFYFDFISPFSYLAWLKLPQFSARLAFEPVPILFAAVLDRIGQKGPAEIPAKRDFTYRFVQWQAERVGVALRFPPAHPFNPLAALRLCVAAGASSAAIDAIFAHLWRDGLAGDTPVALEPVARQLGVADVAAAVEAPEVKSKVRENTETALTAGVFGVPTVLVDGLAFWGNDALPMLAQYLDDPAHFERGEYARLAMLPTAATRV
jgi:2-hydroxychromene-2-carboxylate isomerase